MNALILHAGALGDCVLTIHVAMALRRAGYRVTLAARSSITAWATRRQFVDQFIWFERLTWLLNPHSPSPDAETLQRFDLTISFLGSPNEEIAMRLDRWLIPPIIHLDPKPTDKTSHRGIHITQQWLEHITGQLSDMKFQISDFQLSRERDPLPLRKDQTIKAPNILVHPGSGGRAKCCPLDAMERLVAEFHVRGCDVRWMIGPDEVERDGPALCQRLEQSAPVVFEESVEAAADIVAQANMFIGNDAGMTHVAALAGVCTLALFGPTDPRIWRPLGPQVRVVAFPKSNQEMMWVHTLVSTLLNNTSTSTSNQD